MQELLEPSSFPAYRRVSTLMRLPARSLGMVRTRSSKVNPVELAGALARDAEPDETVPQSAHREAVVPRKRAASRVVAFREGWKHWVALNATDLIWTALIIGGVLFTSCLMRG